MSFVLWYMIEIAEAEQPGGRVTGAAAGRFGPGLPLRVSNDVLSGSLVIDADVTVTMTDGASADTFEISLINLPGQVTDLIKNTHAAGPVNTTIHLGYFDEPTTRTTAGRVLVGRVVTVTGGVGDDGLSRTVLRGQEEGGYLLRNTPVELDRRAGTETVDLAKSLAKAAGVSLADGSTIGGGPRDLTVRAGSALDALGALAAQADVPLVVRDGAVYLGSAVGALTDPAPVVFDPDTNLVSLSSSTSEDTEARPVFPPRPAVDDVPRAESAVLPPVRTTLDLTVLGHPRLRVGQVATTTGLSGVPAGTLRVSHVEHSFRVGAGYTARLRLIAADPGERAQVRTGVQGVVDRWRDVVDRSRADHPSVDLGEVTEYVPGADGRHVASLHYGQRPEPGAVAPSVTTPIDTAVELNDKPIVSPFAFHRTGLMTPVYPKMRAVLAHNRGQVDDALITGYVWPDNPAQECPPNRVGDHWLALPTGLGEDGLPRGKGANDLTDAAGQRVVQVAALHVLVGTDALPEVGTRPDPPTDNSITIEHQSGTMITVDSEGAVTISTSDRPITLTNGSVSMKLDGSAVAVT
ncbi:hypothetical protein ACOT81_37325 [Streptomyces sp. WI04-05B]|uniref:hypothetical protein n=1 Tax=Streptomyces TaxID=1883 RepID=UPI0029A5C163|nr:MULTISPECIES: hypothetical protein [unclassified Streptomyces]MDX2547453.1 hypothetical protein [Streptomyces sp. WI04-05B]MDX2586288.1 hypothetical protein [Streptomyces sp. WI04-05A]MDX3748938.1 hypothetical protein [Streptomyces sp. AK08-02]